MLDYTRSAVTRNQSEKKINSLLDHVAASTDMRLLQASLQSLMGLSHPRTTIEIFEGKGVFGKISEMPN